MDKIMNGLLENYTMGETIFKVICHTDDAMLNQKTTCKSYCKFIIAAKQLNMVLKKPNDNFKRAKKM